VSNSQEKPISPRLLLEAEFIAKRNEFFVVLIQEKPETLGQRNIHPRSLYDFFIGGTPEFYYTLADNLLRWMPEEMLIDQIKTYQKSIDTMNDAMNGII
jgi:hypothetical protein